MIRLYRSPARPSPYQRRLEIFLLEPKSDRALRGLFSNNFVLYSLSVFVEISSFSTLDRDEPIEAAAYS